MAVLACFWPFFGALDILHFATKLSPDVFSWLQGGSKHFTTPFEGSPPPTQLTNPSHKSQLSRAINYYWAILDSWKYPYRQVRTMLCYYLEAISCSSILSSFKKVIRKLANGKQEGTEEDVTLLHFSTSELQKNFKAENGAAKKFHNPEIKYKGGW